MDELIATIDQLLAERRKDYYVCLQPGATTLELRQFEEAIGFSMPRSFWHLYSWRNGQDPASSEALDKNWLFMPLDEILETKFLLDAMIETDFTEPHLWQRGWIPFLHNGGGSYLCIDLTAGAGQLIAFWKADTDRPVVFPSLEAWLRRFADTGYSQANCIDRVEQLC